MFDNDLNQEEMQNSGNSRNTFNKLSFFGNDHQHFLSVER